MESNCDSLPAGLALRRTGISQQCWTLTEFSPEGKGRRPSHKRHKVCPSCDTKNSLISTMKMFCLDSEYAEGIARVTDISRLGAFKCYVKGAVGIVSHEGF